MHLSDRLRRLERLRADDDRMTADEIASAARDFDARLSALSRDDLEIVLPTAAKAAWHGLVHRPGPGFMQRTFASMDPMDIYV